MSAIDDKPFKTFLCEYPFAGERWCFEIKAESHEDAEARIKAMPFAQVSGQCLVRVDLPPLHRLWRWLTGGK